MVRLLTLDSELVIVFSWYVQSLIVSAAGVVSYIMLLFEFYFSIVWLCFCLKLVVIVVVVVAVAVAAAAAAVCTASSNVPCESKKLHHYIFH